MAGKSQSPPPRKAVDWRGKSGKSTVASKSLWQDSQDAHHSRLTRINSFWRTWIVTGFLLLAFLCSFLLLRTLLQREEQFPFLTVVQTTYPQVLPPNAWSHEDLESLRTGADALDHKTLEVIDLSANQRNSEYLLLNSPDERTRAIRQAKKSGLIVFYLSMHGAVNDKGEACVVTLDATPVDANTWLPVSQLLVQIKSWNLGDKTHKLLILDCNRQASNSAIGMVENNFASRLRHALEETPIPNLVILNSTSAGETGLASAEMRGSVFGQFLRVGLAGAADLPQEGGNHDRRVSLKELHRYLVKHVDGWARENRGVHQKPQLIPSNAGDFSLTCSLDRVGLNNLLSRFASTAAPEPAVSSGQLEELWTGFNDLLNHDADSFAPLELGKSRRQLIWLEQASRAGAAYRQDAIAVEGELKRLITKLRERISHQAVSSEAAKRSVAAAEYQGAAVPGLALRLRSIPLLARLGRIETPVISGLIESLHQLEAEPTLDKLESILESTPGKQIADVQSLVGFLRLMKRSLQLRGVHELASGSLSSIFELQSLAAEGAVPSDPRAYAWIRLAADPADVARRQTEDGILTGALDTDDLEAAKLAYRDGLSVDATMREALILTDRIVAEMPHLIRWHESQAANSSSSSSETSKALLNLVSATHLVLKTLDSPSDSDAGATSLSFLPQFQSLKQQYESLRQKFDAAYEKLVNNSELNPDLAQQAAVILNLPLLSSRDTESGDSPQKQRKKLQDWYLEASHTLHRRLVERKGRVTATQEPKLPTTEKSESDAEEIVEESSRSHHRAEYPLLAHLELLATDFAPAKSSSDQIGLATNADAAGASIRRLLKSFPEEIEAAHKRHLTSTEHTRRELAHAANLGRGWAAFNASAWSIDPVAELQRGDIQQVLLWHARRYIDDFWGPAIPGDRSFFEAACGDTLEAARLVAITNPAVEKQFNELKSLLALRQKAAQEGLVVHADALLLVDLVEHPAARISISNPLSRGSLPPGTAMMRIVDREDHLLGPVVDFLTVPNGAEESSHSRELKVAVGGEHRKLSDTVGAATAVFRGHEFRDDLIIKTAAGATVESRPYTTHNARIRLNGDKRQKASVVFILDCSASMQKDMTFEATIAMVSRMDVAKAALVRMLNALASRGDARVGVILYGHRVGWNTKQPNQLLTQSAWGDSIPDNLKPYEDVETILPLGRFDSIAAAKVEQRLQKVKPWGETPLYLSLTQALQEFREDESDTQRSIVVITDGINYQFNPRPEMAKTAADVLAADASRKIPLHIVGFGIQASDADSALREFSRLADETGGQYVTVSEAAALAGTLEGILQRRPYTVVSPSGKVQKAPIGTAIDVIWDSDVPQEYLVAIGNLSEAIEVTGGEAVELLISQDGQSIYSAAYDAGAPVFSSLVGGSDQDLSGVRLGAHLPRREDSNVIFDLSLQHAEQDFVDRPRETWVEITPIMADKRPVANQKYIIYDPEFIPRTPVPVLRAVAHDWPKNAVRARIDFWCKWNFTEPSQLIPFQKLPAAGSPATAGDAIEGIPGMKYQLRRAIGTPTRIDFIETYAADAPRGTMLKVDIIGQIRPSRTLRQFDEINRFATHSFFFEDGQENLINATDSIRIVSRRRMFDDAWHLDSPLVIEVPALSDTVPPLR